MESRCLLSFGLRTDLLATDALHRYQDHRRNMCGGSDTSVATAITGPPHVCNNLLRGFRKKNPQRPSALSYNVHLHYEKQPKENSPKKQKPRIADA